MIRVLQVTGILNRGGAETMIMNLFRHIDRTRVQFDFVANSLETGDYEEEIRSLGGKVYHCPHYRGMNIFQYIHWWKGFLLEHANEYPVIHGHIGSAAPIYLYLAKKHGIHTIAHSHSTKERFLYHVHSLLTRQIADSFLACSPLAGICRYGNDIVNDEKRFHVLRNAMDLYRYHFQPEIRKKIREELGLVNENLVLGHVGRFESVKNHEFLLQLFSAIARKRGDARLLLVGDGVLKPSTEKLAETLKIQDKVIFAGIRKDVPEIMQAMDCFLLPSYYEGLSLVAVEAQTSGLPCCFSENVPRDNALTDLCTFLPLNNIDAWVNQLCSFKSKTRQSHEEEIQVAGYDIHDTAAWLTDYYFGLAETLN